MSVVYAKGVSRATSRARKVGREFTVRPENPPKAVPSKHSKKKKRIRKSMSKASRKRTPDPVESPLSVAALTIHDATELKSLMSESLRGFAVELGVQVAACLLEDDVVKLCGEKSERILNRTHNRHGSQRGFVILNGQKVAINRPRVRSVDGEETPLTVYNQLQCEDAMPAAAFTKMVRGVSCRDYGAVVETARAGFGVKKSSVSKNFVAASAKQLEEFDQRRFDNVTFAAAFMDGVNFGGQSLVVALGVSDDGTKYVLGLRQGETENAEVVTALLTDLRDRGVSTDQPTLFCMDGSKALRVGVKRVFGSNAIIQRCRIHKMRNVEAHVPKKHHDQLRRRLNRAYANTNHANAMTQLKDTVAWLRTINRDAANSLLEGMEETLTVTKLGLTGDLRRFFSSTNAIESTFSRVRQVTRRVKRWRDGNMRHRWCVAGLLRAEEGFRRIRGFRELPSLLEALNAMSVDNI